MHVLFGLWLAPGGMRREVCTFWCVHGEEKFTVNLHVEAVGLSWYVAYKSGVDLSFAMGMKGY
jgi:hypothetical protein